MNRRLTIVIRILAITAIAAGLWWFVRAMDFGALGRALRSAKLWPLVVAAALNFVCLWGKAVCWRLMLAPRHRVSVIRLFRYTIATFAASAIAPARAGEVLRVWVLKRRDGVPAADTAAVAVAEKLLDGISMLILVAPVPWLLPVPSWVAGSIALCAAIAIALFIGLYIAVGRVGRVDSATSRTLVRRFLAGMHVLRSPKRLLFALGVLILVWAADLGEVMAVLYAVDIHLPVAAGLLILFTLNLTIMVPSTPAQVGALEVGALAALELLHVGHEAALAFALLYHALQVIPLIAAGLTFELRLVLGREGDPTAHAVTNGEAAKPEVLAPCKPEPEPPAAAPEPPAASATHTRP
ncbi:MAG TPA: lysylphosphatidylglycerol synthase transmembrane domain-containing protein [Kofleriaceae bacterium]|nr:lysylphosphatidylglycerol synthase transmembrane domain-containing protein [Kofleriaceae bacterium]